MDELLEAIGNRKYVLQCKLPTYVKVFVQKFDEEGYFVHKLREPVKSFNGRGDTLNCFSDSSDLDLTGSPLKFSYYSVQCNDTTIVQQTDWLTDEENHVGLTKQEACTLLSHYFMKIPNGERKFWIACNGLDSQTTLLLAGHKKEGWVSRTRVQFCGLYPIDSPEMNPRRMEEQHALMAHAQCNTRPEVFCTYDIFESGTVGGKPGPDCSLIESNVKVKVDLYWNSATLKPQSEEVTANLTVQVNVGHYCSEVLPLWQQLCLLERLIKVRSAAEADRKQPVLPNSSADSSVPVSEQVLKILHGPSKYKPPWSEVQTKGSENRGLLKDVVQEIVQSKPESQELTHRLWLVLGGCSDIIELMDCLELIFSEVKNHRARPFVRPNNQSTIAQVILKMMKDEATSIKLTGIIAVEFLIEIGIEKLTQDYTAIFMKAGLGSVEQLKTGFPADESGCRLERSLTWLARLHSSLEVLLAAQPHIKFPRVSLYSLALQIIDSCTKNIQSLDSLKQDPLVSLLLPVPFQDVKNRLPSSFTRWRLTLGTDSGSKKVTSMFLCSSSTIFPPSVYTNDATVVDETKEQYYLFKLSCWNDQILTS
ncbi:protein zwilch homolog [Anabrus simplex]|uniref:protein zwilch homolog n=1 Tax=Anabrus simplex TaxID=316456 RepID=UPI0035A2D2F7